jgi:tetratricopeptide (TPR) repeat protein
VDSIVYGNLRIEFLDQHGGRVQRITARTRPPAIHERPRPLPDGPVGGVRGRADEIAAAQAATAGAPVGFHGGCGAGKTTLLRHLAVRSAAGNAVYLRVAGQRLDDVLQELLDELFVTDQPFKPTPEQRAQVLERVHALVLLDDVTFGQGELRDLLDVLPGCSVVVAYEQPVLGGLDRSVQLAGLDDDDALDLLGDGLGRRPIGAERADALRLCWIVQGHPLHLRQAAALVRTGRHSFADLVGLAQSDVAALDRLSVDELAEQERRALAVLALAAGVVLPAEIVGALAELSGAEAALRSLGRRGLVDQDGDRFGLPVCRAADHRELLQVHLQLGQAVRQVADAVARQDWTGDQALGAAQAALAIIRYAAERAQWRAVVSLVDAVEPVLAVAGRWEAWRQALEWGLEAARVAGDVGAEAKFSHQLGTLEFALDDLERARSLWRRALRLREELGDRAGAAVTRANLALIEPVPVGPGPRPPVDRRRTPWRAVVVVLAVLAVLAIVVPLALGGPSDSTAVVASQSSAETTTPPGSETTTPPSSETTTPPSSETTTPTRPNVAAAELDPSALTFRARGVRRPTSAEARVRNTGTAPLVVNGLRLDGADPDAFLFDGTACTAGPVTPGGSCPIQVAFLALAPGTSTATLLIDHGAPGSPATLALTGQVPSRPQPPDLTPSDLHLEGNQTLVVTVQNLGSGDAGPSTAEASFSSGAVRPVETPAIPAGGSVQLRTEVPADCFSPDCGFSIEVDAGQQLNESDESNNRASDSVIG